MCATAAPSLHLKTRLLGRSGHDLLQEHQPRNRGEVADLQPAVVSVLMVQESWYSKKSRIQIPNLSNEKDHYAHMTCKGFPGGEMISRLEAEIITIGLEHPVVTTKQGSLQ